MQPNWIGTAWASWWTSHAFTQGMRPFESAWNAFPVEQSPRSQYNLLNTLLFWPLLMIRGTQIGDNHVDVETT